jgi:hypothetical protein
MIVCQAVIAFCKICRQHFKSPEKDTQATQREIARVMFANW